MSESSPISYFMPRTQACTDSRTRLGEGVKTNIFGSVNVADAALAAGAEAMVMISTDKAIEPVSMLGLTKAVRRDVLPGARSHPALQSSGKPRCV